MARILLFLPILVLSLFIISTAVHANVIVVDSEATNIEGPPAFSDENVPTGSGQAGDYVIIACGVTSENPNSFDAPFPGVWTELDDGECDSPAGNCFQGIWGRFVDNPASEDITCEWNFGSSVFVSGSFRYIEVDPIDPIIDVACDSGQEFGANVMATAPSINTEAGSQVVRVFTFRNLNSLGSGNLSSILGNGFGGSFIADSTLNMTNNVHMRATTDLVFADGPTGTASIETGLDTEWRACTIALRMLSNERAVPTMSEWGLIGFAAFAGIAGVWYLRRRQATA